MTLQKKLSEILITSLLLFLVAYVWLSSFATLAKAPVVTYVATGVDGVQKSLQSLISSQYSEPLSIEIKSIKLNVAIESVGIEKDGSMQVPHDFFKVGWLKTSSKLGQNGNLVLSGHFDTSTGAPAVFYNLENVKKDDVIVVRTQLTSGIIDNKSYTVTETYLADPNNNDHVKEVYKNTKNPTITLITCNGIWDPVKREYSRRVVVKGELSK